MTYVSFPYPTSPFSRKHKHKHKHKHNSSVYHVPLFSFDIRIQRDIHEYRVGCMYTCVSRSGFSGFDVTSSWGATALVGVCDGG
jgi:hypothetical protein